MMLHHNEKVSYLKKEFGNLPFTYVGDSRSDFALWQHAESAIGINPNWMVNRRLLKHRTSEIIRDRASLWSLSLKQIRVFQWPKNLLVFKIGRAHV